jgi:hypothetical protein
MESGTSTVLHWLYFFGSDSVARSTLSVWGEGQSAGTSIEVNPLLDAIPQMTWIQRNISAVFSALGIFLNSTVMVLCPSNAANSARSSISSSLSCTVSLICLPMAACNILSFAWHSSLVFGRSIVMPTDFIRVVKAGVRST